MLSAAKQYIEDVHGQNDNKTYVTIFKKKVHSIGHYLPLTSNVYHHMENYFTYGHTEDLYLSLNTFYRPVRSLGTLRWLNALYIDIDCYKLGLEKEAVIFELEENRFDRTVPMPSKVIDSGRGLYLVWLITPVPSQAVKLWNALQRYLFEQLKSLGADRQSLDATRVLRVPGSVNSKTGTTVKVMTDSGIRYTLKELKEEYLPKIQPRASQKSRSRAKTMSLFTDYSLYKARIEDLYTLCKLRRQDLIGYRERLLFLLRYYLCCIHNDEKKALHETLELNSNFRTPLAEAEVKNCTRSAEKYYNQGGIKLKNSKIVEWLEISPEEQRHMKALIARDEKNNRSATQKRAIRRNKNGLTQRQQQKMSTRAAIVFHTRLGKDKHQISRQLGLHIKTVEKHLKEARKIGLNLRKRKMRKRIRIKLNRQYYVGKLRLVYNCEKDSKEARRTSSIALLDTG